MNNNTKLMNNVQINEDKKEPKLEINQDNVPKISDPIVISNDLTNPNAFDITMNSIYFSQKCVYFYIILLVSSIIVFIFLVYFFLTDNSKRLSVYLIIMEGILNVILVLDIIFRIKVFGFYRFLRTNKIDIIITLIIIFCFFSALFSINLSSTKFYI